MVDHAIDRVATVRSWGTIGIWCIAAMLLLLQLQWAYWQYIDYAEWNPLGGPPISIDLQLHTPEVKPGETAIVSYGWSDRRVCPHVIELWWSDDGARRLISRVTQPVPSSAPNDFRRQEIIPIPDDASPGIVAVAAEASSQCNPIAVWRSLRESVLRIQDR